MQRPLATVIVGGMFLGPVMLLLVVPALRMIFLGRDEHSSSEVQAGMKTACLLVLMMSWAALTAVGEVAEPPVSTHRVARKSVLPKANLPKPPVNRRPRSLPGNSLHQGVLNKSGVRLSGGLIQGETIHNGLPVRTSGVVRPSAPSVNTVLHRSPNPAVVGGPVHFHSSSYRGHQRNAHEA